MRAALDPEVRRALVTALILSFGPAVANSFARFAYALILPAMRSDLSLSYAQAGWLGTANAIGYLAGAVLTRELVEHLGHRRLFVIGMYVTGLSIGLTGLTDHSPALSICRMLAGLGGAAVFICGGSLSANILPTRPEWSTTTITLYFAGGGIGFVLSGIAIPLLLQFWGSESWPLAWQAMGVTALLMAAASTRAAACIAEPTRAFASGPARPRANTNTETPRSGAQTRLRAALLAYVCFGLGYIGYMTFIIAWMQAHEAPVTEVVAVWTALGLATMAAPAIWRGPFRDWPGGRPLAVTMGLLTLGASLPLVSTDTVVLLGSGLCVGASVFAVPSAIQSLVRKGVAPDRWGQTMANFTIAFALGQIAGPIMAGWLADLWGSLFPGLVASGIILVLGVALALGQPEVRADQEKSCPPHNP